MASPIFVDALEVHVHLTIDDLVRDAADIASVAIRSAIADRGVANVMLATGNSQIAFLERLVRDVSIDWHAVVGFHMDEYIGMAPSHPASFQRYMRERVNAFVEFGSFEYLYGDAADAEGEADRYGALLKEHPLDLCCLGIGENGHLAFNDPPVADFNDPRTVKIVSLDDACKRQQVGEGHFATIADVPPTALTVTIPGLLQAKKVLAIVPESRKARAVRDALVGPISTACPASALRTADHAVLLLDRDSAALFDPE